MDHINDDGKKHRLEMGISHRGASSGTRIYEVIQRLGKIEGLQVLCANCNTMKQLRLCRRKAIKDDLLHREIETLYGNYDS